MFQSKISGEIFVRLTVFVSADLENDLAHYACDALVQDLGHDQVEETLLLPEEDHLVVLVSGQVVERVGGATEHVEGGSHGVGVVPQRVHAVLLGHHHSVVLSLQQ